MCEGEIFPLLGELAELEKNLSNFEIMGEKGGASLNEHENASFCRVGDWTVSTNPKGRCGQQIAHIREDYSYKIESLKAFVVDTQNAIQAAEKAEQERLAAEALRLELIEEGIVVAEEVAADIKHVYFRDSPDADEQFEKVFNENTILKIRGHHRRSELHQRLNYKSDLILSAKVRTGTSGLASAVEEVVNRMNLKQLEAMHDLCLYPGAWINDRAQRVKGLCGAFKYGL